MSDRQYAIQWPTHVLIDSNQMACMLTDEQVDALESQIKAIREKQEAEKRQVLDFGLNRDEEVVVRDRRLWLNSAGGRLQTTGAQDSDVHILGNLPEIVQDGPIVIGLTLEDAQRALTVGALPVTANNHLVEAVGRYVKGKR